MTNLISGKEALIALANGEDVELQSVGDMNWYESTQWTVGELLCFKGRFRLKPRTITLNGIEVPACGVDYKPHTPMFVLNSLETCEYSRIMLDESAEIPHYWWSTEDEIKQVVAALCQIFGLSGDAVKSLGEVS